MLRALAVTLAMILLTAAAPAQPQPNSAAAPSKAEIAAQEKLANEKREAVMLKSQKATEVRNDAWDSRMKRTMSGVCRGC